MGRLAGKIALVTGGTSGIGLASAKRFVQEGALVYITGRKQESLDEAVQAIGKGVTGVQGDVANADDMDRLFKQIKEEQGRLDVVFANAGIAEFAPLGSITEDQYHRLFDTNVKGMILTVQGALPLLPDGSSIILTASIVASKGLGGNSIYAATKAVARSFARNWTTDMKERRIRVNALSPGMTDTEGLRGLLGSSEAGNKRREQVSANVPLGRMGKPEEVAEAALFLACAESSYVTGSELFVDGGIAQV